MAPKAETTHDAQREILLELQRIPNVGPATARDLVRLGVRRLDDVTEREPGDMFETLCALDGVRHDPCMLDVFTAIVAFARGGDARPWWTFTAERIAAERDRRRGASGGAELPA